MRNGFWALVGAVGCLACSGTGDPSGALLAQVVSSTQCAGGKAIERGHDTNGDGKLSADEVEETELVCAEAVSGGSTVLVERTPEPAGANCAAGGLFIQAGSDLDGDGQLEESEVERAVYGCFSAPPATLSRLLPEAPGAACANGGTAVQVGVDADASGQLEDAEVQGTSYVCGAPPETLLMRSGQPPLGDSTCLQGGTEVAVGADTNGNGQLDVAEVLATHIVCRQSLSGWTYFGDYTVRTAADVAAIAAASRIAGELRIVETELEEVVLGDNLTVVERLVLRGNPRLVRFSSRLKTVLGTLRVEDNAVLADFWHSLRLVQGDANFEHNPALALLNVAGEITRYLGHLKVSHNPALVHLFLDDVRSIGGDLTLTDNAAMRYLLDTNGWGRDRELGGSFVLEDNAILERAELAITRLGRDVRISRNPMLTSFIIPLTQLPGSLVVEDAPRLTHVQGLRNLEQVGGDLRLARLDGSGGVFLDALRYVGGDLYLDGLSGLTSSTHLDALQAVGGSLVVQDNPKLYSAYFTGLGTVGGLAVARNPLLEWFVAGELSHADSLYVVENARLPKLTGLGGLASVTSLGIVRNPALTSLGLDHLHSVWELAIEDNVALPTCLALAFRRQLVEGVITGPKVIRGNAGDASSCP